MKSIALTMTCAALLAFAASGPAAAQEAVAKSSGCLNCHAIDTKKMGPSFKDVAAKYKGKPDAEAVLVAKISGAKDHPSVKATPEEIKGLVKWVLAM